MSASQALAVPFHGAELFVVEHNGQPYTPMKPIVEGMGLDWASQFTKLKQRFATWIVEITIQLPGDSQRRAVIFLPLRKLAGWLYSINAGKVRPEIHEKVLQYQAECDDALWDYWTKGQAIRTPYGLKELPPGKPKKSTKCLPGCLTLEQQEAVRTLVKSRAESIPSQPLWGPAAQRMWGSIKSKFGVGYKEIPAEQFAEVLSLVARVPLEGEHIAAGTGLPEQTELPFQMLFNTRLLVTVEEGRMTHAEVVSPEQYVIYQTIQKKGVKLVDPASEDSVDRFFNQCVPDSMVYHVTLISLNRLAKQALPQH